MKKVTELGKNECIHCETQEEWDAILALNPDNNVDNSNYTRYKQDTCYDPSYDKGTGGFSPLEYYKEQGRRIHKAKDFLEPQFKQGEIVECEVKEGIYVEFNYLCFDGTRHWVTDSSIGSKIATAFKECRKPTKKVTLNGEELTPEEAINKLKEMV